MAQPTIIFYPSLYFKAEYAHQKTTISFRVWKITGLNELNPELSEIQDPDPCLTGFIKYDGCCEFDLSTHICSIKGAENFLELLKQIYAYKNTVLEKF